MTTTPTSKTMNILLWTAQILLSLFMLSGTVMKFMPVDTMAPIMPWMGQLPPVLVRLLGVVDLLGGLGLILPAVLNIKPQLVVWTAYGIILLMLSAIVFHFCRGEGSATRFNIVCVLLAVFIAWGRAK